MRTVTSLLLAGLGLGTWRCVEAVEEVMPEVAKVDTLVQHPGANLSFLDGTVRVLGKAVLTTSAQNHWNEGDGRYYEATGSGLGAVEARWTPVKDHRFTMEATAGRAFSSHDGPGDPVGGVRVDWLSTGRRLTNRIEGAGSIDQIDLAQTGKPVDRADWRLLDHLQWEGPSTSLQLGPRLSWERYRGNTFFSTDRQQDSARAALSARITHRTGTRLSWIGTADLGRLRRLDPDPYQDGSIIRIGAGAEWSPSERITVRLGAGGGWWRMADNYNREPQWNDARVVVAEGLASCAWEYREQCSLSLLADRQTDVGFGANVATLSRALLQWEHRTGPRMLLNIHAGPLHVLNSGGPAGSGPESRIEWSAKGVVDWRFERGVILRWYVVGVHSRSLIAPDFSRSATSLQAMLAF